MIKKVLFIILLWVGGLSAVSTEKKVDLLATGFKELVKKQGELEEEMVKIQGNVERLLVEVDAYLLDLSRAKNKTIKQPSSETPRKRKRRAERIKNKDK